MNTKKVVMISLLCLLTLSSISFSFAEGESSTKKDILEKKIQRYIEEFKKEENEGIIEELPEAIKFEIYEIYKVTDMLDRVKSTCLDNTILNKELNKILFKCKEIKKDIKPNRIQGYIDEFKKEENKEIIKEFPEKIKYIIDNLDEIKSACLNGKITDKEVEEVLNKCKEIKKEINLYKLQNYIEELKKEENKEIIK